MSFLTQYRRAVADGTLKPDTAQEKAAAKLQALSAAMKSYRPGRTLFGGLREAPRGLYLWGGVGRGKSMLMDMFFEATPARTKRRIHFNAFMVETHARIHAERESGRSADPQRQRTVLRPQGLCRAAPETGRDKEPALRGISGPRR